MNLELRQAKEIEAMVKEFNKRSGITFDVRKIVNVFDEIQGMYDHDIMQPKYEFETEEHKQERYYDKAVRSYSESYKKGLADIVRESTKADAGKKNLSIHALELYDDLMTKSFEILFPAMEDAKYANGGLSWYDYKKVYFDNLQSLKSSEYKAELLKNGNYDSFNLTNELLWKNQEFSQNPKADTEAYKDLASLYVVAKEHYENKGFFAKYFTKEGWAERHELKVSKAILTIKAKEMDLSFEDGLKAMDITNPSTYGRNTYTALKNVKCRFTDDVKVAFDTEMDKARDKASDLYYAAVLPKKAVTQEITVASLPEKEEEPVLHEIPYEGENEVKYEAGLEVIDEEPEQVSVDLGEEDTEVVPFEVVNESSSLEAVMA